MEQNMSDFVLWVSGVLIGYAVGWRKSHKVDIEIKVDSKKAIMDLETAEEAIKKLKREMNI